MKRLKICLAGVVLLFSMAVFAQEKHKLPPPPKVIPEVKPPEPRKMTSPKLVKPPKPPKPKMPSPLPPIPQKNEEQ